MHAKCAFSRICIVYVDVLWNYAEYTGCKHDEDNEMQNLSVFLVTLSKIQRGFKVRKPVALEWVVDFLYM